MGPGFLLHSPGLGGMRIAVGLAAAVHVAWLAAWCFGGGAKVPAGVQPSMRDLVRGIGFALDPDKVSDALKAPASTRAPAGEDAASTGVAEPPEAPADEGPIRQSPQQRLSCPSGYYLKEQLCIPFESENLNPYQGLANTARMMLVGAAVLAAISLALMVQSAGLLQLLGGMLLGATLALALAAVAIGNRIGDEVSGTASRAAAGRPL